MKRLLSIAIIIGIATASCVKEDYFGLLESGNIKTLLVSNQAGNAVIDIDAKTVEIEIPGGIDLQRSPYKNWNYPHLPLQIKE